jgi:hypothetical protein
MKRDREEEMMELISALIGALKIPQMVSFLVSVCSKGYSPTGLCYLKLDAEAATSTNRVGL